jgi:hypothetical protein
MTKLSSIPMPLWPNFVRFNDGMPDDGFKFSNKMARWLLCGGGSLYTV